MQKKSDNSYGIIPVFKKDNGEYLFLIVLHSEGRHWAFPKGHPLQNEAPIDTAKRELYEETGITDCVIPENITFEENYSFEQDGRKINKTVTYFLGFTDNQKIETSKEFDQEISENRWVDYDEALRLITYDEAKEMLKKLKRLYP
ncbi:MAG: NUDIX domain-containing protein [Patescibacteria group bacterium]